jgi:predicted transcriptional regulator
MLVREWMSKEVITVDEDQTMQHAIGLLKEHNIHMLPVMKNKKVGVILTSYEKVPDGFGNVYIRFFDLDRRVLETLKKNLFEISKVLYIVDHRENKREIFET